MKIVISTLRRIRTLIIVAIAAFVLVAVVGLVFVPYEETVTAAGIVIAQQERRVYAPEEGVIEAVDVREGEWVAAGQSLIRLDPRELLGRQAQLETELKETEAVVELKKAQLAKVTALPLPKEFWHTHTELAAAERRARFAAAEYVRSKELMQAGILPTQQFEKIQLANELAAGALSNAQARVDILQGGLEDIILKAALAELNTALARQSRLQVTLDLCGQDLDRCIIRATRAGQVTLLLEKQPGALVEKGEPMLHLAGDGTRYAELLAGESQIHRIRAGQRVRLTTKAFNTRRYGYITATVTEVALEPSQRADGEFPATEYLVKARIDFSPIPLTLGSTLDARIILGRVSLWRFIFL